MRLPRKVEPLHLFALALTLCFTILALTAVRNQISIWSEAHAARLTSRVLQHCA